MPNRTDTRSALTRGLASLVLIALIALSWTQLLDHQAQAGAAATLKRALATYAIARGLNGVISVAQGTEIAVQPVGIGLTITAGEPAERSGGTVFLAAVMTCTLVTYLITLWWPPMFRGRAVVHSRPSPAGKPRLPCCSASAISSMHGAKR